MAEYIERGELLEDIAESVVHTVRVGYPSPEVRGANKVIDRIKSAPVADVVEVVRCRDCEYAEADYGCGGDIMNPFQYRCTYEGDSWNRPDHFCSYGKRKEGAEE